MLSAAPSAAASSSAFRASAFPRRLTVDTLTALRRRRTGPARGLRRPLRQQQCREGDDDDDDDDYDDDDDGDASLFSILCCWCVGPRCMVAACMLATTMALWNAAHRYGIVHQPSYEQLVTPIRVARQRWTHKTPTGADDGFILFDRNADGLIDAADMRIVAKLTTGEHPTEEQLRAYIAKGDANGDGALDELEYLGLLAAERAEKRAKAGQRRA